MIDGGRKDGKRGRKEGRKEKKRKQGREVDGWKKGKIRKERWMCMER